jgi:hypothetical protein
MLRQNRMEGVSPSISGRRVAPVVVNPLIASKVESSRLWNVPSIRKGAPPRRAATTHASVTER